MEEKEKKEIYPVNTAALQENTDQRKNLRDSHLTHKFSTA